MNSVSRRQDSINQIVYRKAKTVTEYLPELAQLFPGERNIIDRHKLDISGKPVLDIGVGAGRTTSAMLELTDHYTGIDWSGPMIEACKARFPSATFVRCDARDLQSLGQDKYGFIWYSFNGLDCINHEDRQAVIGQVFKLLQSGGLFFFSSHNLASRREKPWQPSVYRWSWNAGSIVKNLALIGKGLLNYMRYKRLHVECDHFAILTDSGHEFGCLHYYVDPVDQLRRLSEFGFVDVQTLGWSGEELPPTHPRISQLPHVYFLARKP